MNIITAVARGDSVYSEIATPVPWWSYTKTVLAAAALALVAQGRLPLDDRLDGRGFSLRHLLQHRAGLPDYGSLSAYHAAAAAGESPWPAQEMQDRVGTDTLLFEPGQGWAYSNVGYLLVRNLIEQAADAPLGVALERLVLAPLGIAGVMVAREPADLAATAWGNERRYHPGWVYHGLLIGPAGSAVWLLHRLLGGALLPAALIAEMIVSHNLGGPIPGRPWTAPGYGMGLMIGPRKPHGLYVGHTGGGPGSTSAVYQYVPEDGDPRLRRKAAAFAPVDDPGVVETRALSLAFCEQV